MPNYLHQLKDLHDESCLFLHEIILIIAKNYKEQSFKKEDCS